MRATLYPTPANPYYPDYAEDDAVYRERFNTAPMPGGLPRRTTFAGLGHLRFARPGMGAIPMLGGKGVIGGPTDPIANFGKRGATLVIAAMRGVPKEQRTVAIKATLDAIEPGLAEKVSLKARNLQQTKGYAASIALEKALAATFANRVTNQMVRVGRGSPVPTQGLLGLGSHEGCQCAIQRLQGQMGLGGFWSKAWGTTKDIGTNIAKYSPPGLVYQGGKYTYQKGVKPVGKAIKKGAKAAYNAGKKALKGLGALACGLAGSGALSAAAGPAGAAAGGPGGAEMAMKGAEMLKNMCGGGEQPVEVEPGGGIGLQVGIAGGALALLAFLI